MLIISFLFFFYFDHKSQWVRKMNIWWHDSGFSFCLWTHHSLIGIRTLTLASFSQFCRLRHCINPLARGKLPHQLLFYFFEISDGKKLQEETQNSDVERRLLLSENCIREFPRDHEAYLKFKDEDGQAWTFRCRVPPGGGSKPALSGDWFSFVRSIEIALDREKDEAGGSQFTIKVKKTTSTTRN